jgi:hypothetical protein
MTGRNFVACVRDMRDMYNDVRNRTVTCKAWDVKIKPLKLAFEAHQKLFFSHGSVDDHVVAISQVTALADLDGSLSVTHFKDELLSQYQRWLRESRRHPAFLRYGWTYFGVAVTQININSERLERTDMRNKKKNNNP